ncbi:unnamed protein product [Microthlaspi erraticum]|uniref:Uncharacterized protein n=1 Tax=Microthlaspi erraticum TaxID=1685480 RepID=A0A6D2L2B1_9BRAS|nr:unnamed protein product [Microthlaspi erraticum]
MKECVEHIIHKQGDAPCDAADNAIIVVLLDTLKNVRDAGYTPLVAFRPDNAAHATLNLYAFDSLFWRRLLCLGDDAGRRLKDGLSRLPNAMDRYVERHVVFEELEVEEKQVEVEELEVKKKSEKSRTTKCKSKSPPKRKRLVKKKTEESEGKEIHEDEEMVKKKRSPGNS